MDDETLLRLSHTHDRHLLAEEAQHGRSYPIRLQARARLAELVERHDGMRARLREWREEVRIALESVEESAVHEFETLGDAERWVRAHVLPSSHWSSMALKHVTNLHPDVRVLSGLSMLLEGDEDREGIWNEINELLERRRGEIMPRPARRKRLSSASDPAAVEGGEFDGAAVVTAVGERLDRFVAEQVAVLAERYVERAKRALREEMERIDQQLSAAEDTVVWGAPAWERQSISSAAEAARTHERQAAPVCFDESVFRDHILYFETKPRRIRRRVGSTRPSDFVQIRDEWEHLSRRLALSRMDWDAFERLMFSRIPLLDGEVDDASLEAGFRAFLPAHAGSAFETMWIERLREHGVEDHVATRVEWTDESEPDFGGFAEIGTANDARVRERLLEAGAKVEEDVLELPIYRSWAVVEPGHSLVATIAGARGPVEVRYAPHDEVGSVEEREYRHVLRCNVDERLEEALVEGYAGRLRFASPATLLRLSWKDRSREGSTIESLTRFKTLDRVRLETAAETATSLKLSSGGRYEMRVVTPSRVSEEELVASGEWRRVGEDRWLPTSADRAAEYGFPSADDYDAGLERLRGALERLRLEISIEGASSDEWAWMVRDRQWRESPVDRLRTAMWEEKYIVGRRLYDAFVAEVRSTLSGTGVEWSTVVRSVSPDCFEHRVESTVSVREIVQRAPFSERGLLRVHGDPDDIVETVDRLGLGRLAEWVPWAWLGARFARGERVGRVSPVHVEYAAGERSIDLQPGVSIIHGLTGAKTPSDALGRLDSMMASGGIKSIAERRRMQLAMHTMSPLGDIASGIDGGVPCKIGLDPSYGKWVFFAMKPSVLARRDAWFADRDFGGGRCRYDLYTRYAERIGQGRIYGAASADARERHLRETHDRSHNEIWLKHEISWDEIDALFVCDYDGLVEATRARVDAWKAEGRVPEDLIVIPYPARDDGRVLAERMEARARARQGLRGRPRVVRDRIPSGVESFDVRAHVEGLELPSMESSVDEWLSKRGITDDERARALELASARRTARTFDPSKITNSFHSSFSLSQSVSSSFAPSPFSSNK